jgi:hypothetical protein
VVDRGSCPECGYGASFLTPPDAVVAVRSFPRRFRELLLAAEDQEQGLASRPGRDGWSAAAHAAAAAALLDQVADVFRQVAVSDDPVIDPPAVIDGPVPGAAVPTTVPTSVMAVLEALDGASRHLATAMDAVKGEDWRRTGRDREGQVWSALDVARLGVHAGVHHLRAAERVLADLRE